MRNTSGSGLASVGTCRPTTWYWWYCAKQRENTKSRQSSSSSSRTRRVDRAFSLASIASFVHNYSISFNPPPSRLARSRPARSPPFDLSSAGDAKENPRMKDPIDRILNRRRRHRPRHRARFVRFNHSSSSSSFVRRARTLKAAIVAPSRLVKADVADRVAELVAKRFARSERDRLTYPYCTIF